MGKPRLGRSERLRKRHAHTVLHQARHDIVNANLHQPKPAMAKQVIRSKSGVLSVVASSLGSGLSPDKLKSKSHLGYREPRPAGMGPPSIQRQQRFSGSKTCELMHTKDAAPQIGSHKVRPD